MAQRKLGEFLLWLVMNPKELVSYQAEKDKKSLLAKKSGLSPKTQAILLKADLHEILNQLSQEYGPGPGDFMLP